MKVSELLAEIENRSPAEVRRRTKELLRTTPEGSWPYGMPCPLWPELVIVGISPGGSPPKNPSVSLPNAMLGPRAHKHFSHKDTAGYWRKASKLAHAFFLRLDPQATQAESIKLTAHLNCGTSAAGQASANSIECEYVQWVARLLDGALQPRAVIFLGYVGYARKRKGIFRNSWKSAKGLDVDWATPKHLIPVTGSPYRFRCWKSVNSAGRALDVIIWPNHPSRLHGEIWSSTLDALKQTCLSE